jgi:DNA-binding MurR/RpiR family transcriptional regulator
MNNLQTLLEDIVRISDMSDPKIAEAVGCSQPTIWRLRTGVSKTCKSDTYQALVELRGSLIASSQEAA